MGSGKSDRLAPPCRQLCFHDKTETNVHDWQTGSNGANLSFPQALGIPDSAGSSCGPVANEGECAKNSWIVGFVNAMPYITICLL